MFISDIQCIHKPTIITGSVECLECPECLNFGITTKTKKSYVICKSTAESPEELFSAIF